MDQRKTGIEAYPLYWPDGWPRTPDHHRGYSKFKTGFGAARELLFAEIRRMGGTSPILSSNVPLRNDGMPRANMPEPTDRGVAVYFSHQKKDMVFACDKYVNVRDNIYAIAKTIEALRGIERWGASDMMERAFTGFLALPQKGTESWRAVLDFRPEDLVSLDLVETRFRSLVRTYHEAGTNPDRNKFEAVVEARNQARRELGGAA